MYPPPVNPIETAHAVRLWNEFPEWLKQVASKRPPENPPEAREPFNAALDAVHRALLTTRKYVADRDAGGARDTAREDELSMLWSSAASAIYPYDAEFANLCSVKGHGWADERVWSNELYKHEPLEIDQMFARIRDISTERPQRSRETQQKIELWLAYGFGVVFITTIIILAIAFPYPSQFQYTVFRIILALAVAGVAAVIPGIFHLQIRKELVAGGALTFFVVVYFFSPAHLTSRPRPNVPQITSVQKSGDGEVALVRFEPATLDSIYRLSVQVSTDAEAKTIAHEVRIDDPLAGEAIVNLPRPNPPKYYVGLAIKDEDNTVVAKSQKPWELQIPQN